jgi:AmmeMemoRadiSam system protein A
MELADFTDEQGATLVHIARQAVEQALGRGRIERPDEGWLYERGASFVTLTRDGALRGCVGTIHPRAALVEDLEGNALAAAFSDTRFAPLTAAEAPATRFEVSLLSPLRPLAAPTEEDLLARLRPGSDGLVLEWGDFRGTFLPQMWEKLPDRRHFVAHLKRKAGLREDFWAPDVAIWTFAVRHWEEEPLR